MGPICQKNYILFVTKKHAYVDLSLRNSKRQILIKIGKSILSSKSGVVSAYRSVLSVYLTDCTLCGGNKKGIRWYMITIPEQILPDNKKATLLVLLLMDIMGKLGFSEDAICYNFDKVGLKYIKQ